MSKTLFDGHDDYPGGYGHPPGPGFVAGSETSREAAASLGDSETSRDRAKIFRLLRDRGLYGATDEELQTELGIKTQSETPRRGELVRSGHVVQTADKRRTSSGRRASVWMSALVAVPKPQGVPPVTPPPPNTHMVCRPMKANLSIGRAGWVLTTCPACGSECWKTTAEPDPLPPGLGGRLHGLRPGVAAPRDGAPDVKPPEWWTDEVVLAPLWGGLVAVVGWAAVLVLRLEGVLR